ncbi:MAG: T9SS type B sorting domain-containing protein [Ferruginibacter sp.]
MFITYLDNANSSNPVVMKPQSTITYKLKVKDANQCQSLNDVSATITVTAPVKVFAGNDTSVVLNQPFRLNATDANHSGIVHFEWQPATYLDNPFIQSPVSTPSGNISYRVTASTLAGCEGTDDINIKVYKGPEIYVPTAFTPNGDGLNDFLKAIPIGIKKFGYFVVYNRYGEKVFYTEDANKGWDGKYKNVDQPLGSFTWVAQGLDDKGKIIYIKGVVTLIR